MLRALEDFPASHELRPQIAGRQFLMKNNGNKPTIRQLIIASYPQLICPFVLATLVTPQY